MKPLIFFLILAVPAALHPALALEIEHNADCEKLGITPDHFSRWKSARSEEQTTRNRYQTQPPVTTTVRFPVAVPKDAIVHFDYHATLLWQDRTFPNRTDLKGRHTAYHNKKGDIALTLNHNAVYHLDTLTVTNLTCDRAVPSEDEVVKKKEELIGEDDSYLPPTLDNTED